jgi:hypothetical protein
MRAPLRQVAAVKRTGVRRRVNIDDTDLLDILDRILDKGLFLGSANLLVLAQTDLRQANSQISVASMQTNTDRYARPSRSSLTLIRRVLS